jgi:hypothetical protein
MIRAFSAGLLELEDDGALPQAENESAPLALISALQPRPADNFLYKHALISARSQTCG